MIFEQIYGVEALVAAPTLVLLLRVQRQMGIERILVGKGCLALRTCLQVVYVDYVVTENIYSGYFYIKGELFVFKNGKITFSFIIMRFQVIS